MTKVTNSPSGHVCLDTDHTSEHTYSEYLESAFLASFFPMGDFQSHLLSL